MTEDFIPISALGCRMSPQPSEGLPLEWGLTFSKGFALRTVES